MKSTELRNQAVDAEKGQVIGPPNPENGGAPSTVDVWKITCTDRATGDQVWFIMNEDLKNEIVRKLTGGIVLAGGELPKVP